MRKILSVLALVGTPVVAAAQSTVRAVTGMPGSGDSGDSVQVMVLGVAHLVAKRDVHNSTFQDSPLSPKRQAQIAEVVSRLAQFRPTKVLIEQPMGDSVVANRYRRFRAGQYTLEPNEAYQFGFRLAAGVGDSAIYPIDTDGPELIDEKSPRGKRIVDYLETHMTGLSTPPFAAFLARSDTLERNGTYLDLLRYLNTDVAIRANASLYSVLDGLGRDVDDAGSAYVSGWYARNCYIFSNILSVLRPHDRVVIIMGQGHEYLLREFVRLDPNLVYVDPLDYLNRP